MDIQGFLFTDDSTKSMNGTNGWSKLIAASELEGNDVIVFVANTDEEW